MQRRDQYQPRSTENLCHCNKPGFEGQGGPDTTSASLVVVLPTDRMGVRRRRAPETMSARAGPEGWGCGNTWRASGWVKHKTHGPAMLLVACLLLKVKGLKVVSVAARPLMRRPLLLASGGLY